MISHGTLPMAFDASRPARIGLLPRNAQDDSQMRWFEVSQADLVLVRCVQ